MYLLPGSVPGWNSQLSTLLRPTSNCGRHLWSDILYRCVFFFLCVCLLKSNYSLTTLTITVCHTYSSFPLPSKHNNHIVTFLSVSLFTLYLSSHSQNLKQLEQCLVHDKHLRSLCRMQCSTLGVSGGYQESILRVTRVGTLKTERIG